MDLTDRLRRYEAAVGAALPGEYRRFLAGHRQQEEGPSRAVAGHEHLGLESLFEIGSGPGYLQADSTFELVGDVLPKFMVPIGADISGNFYLLDCSGGGAVYWWDHEQDPGEDRVEKVAGSFGDFLALLVPDEKDGGVA
jgi:hypothetical protein